MFLPSKKFGNSTKLKLEKINYVRKDKETGKEIYFPIQHSSFLIKFQVTKDTIFGLITIFVIFITD